MNVRGEPVAWFAEQMEAKLRENEAKWHDSGTNWLLHCLRWEADELRSATHPRCYDSEEVIRAATVVAICAMKIAVEARRINAPETGRGT